MPGRKSFFVALFAAVALLLTSISVDRAAAGHDVKEAWNKYQEARDAAWANENKGYRLNLDREAAQERFYQASHLWNVANWWFPVRFDNALSALNDVENELSAWQYEQNVLEAREHLAERNYNNALNEHVANLFMTAIAPDPGPKKPPTITVRRPQNTTKGSKRRRTQTVKPTRRQQQAHTPTQTQALAIIGGMIIQGISRAGSRSGSRGGRPSSGGGGSSCAGGSCPP